MMRKLILFLAMAFIICSNVVVAEAGPRDECTCISPMGTIEHSCPKHRHCTGIRQHQHESRNLRKDIPVLCRTNFRGLRGFYLLINPNGATCQEIKNKLYKEAIAQNKRILDIAYTYKYATHEERLANSNNPLYQIVDVVKRKTIRRAHRDFFNFF